jgi:hypothetical protein
MLFLDFDGVLIDSAFEAFRVMLATKNMIESPLDSSLDDLYDSFKLLRPHVGPAWNYSYVFKSLKQNIPLQIPINPTAEDIKFEENFFNTRGSFKFSAPLDWIKLHRSYQFSNELSFLLERGSIKLNQIIILTHKDVGSVKALTRHYIPSLSNVVIISMTDFDYSLTKKDIIYTHLDDNLMNFFIDDNIDICSDTIRNNKSNMLKVFLADWGYSNEDDRKETICNCLGYREIVEILSS